MRIWDISPSYLCQKHLLGEHRELHAIWTIITENKKGYSNHPETKRWFGKLAALYKRHENLILEFKKRGYKHNSLLNKKLAVGKQNQDVFVTTLVEQKKILKIKICDCFVT